MLFRSGCVNGPVTSQKDSTAMKRIEVLNYAENCSEKLENEILKSRPKIEGTLPKPNFQSKEHTEEEIRSALRSVGKTQPSDELNCASCGYDSCRSFAKAMLDNRAEKTMCVSYMKKLAQKKANSLIKVIPSGVVIVDKNLKIVECNKNFAKMLGEDILTMYEIQPGLAGAELEKLVNFSNLFTQILSYSGSDSDGEQKNLGNDLQDEMQEDSQEIIDKEIQFGKKILHISVFIIEKEEIAGAVIEDVTTPQVQKRRIVDKAQKVINKNLSTVQKIAFLLGENAAESESILNSIIESFSDEEDDI